MITEFSVDFLSPFQDNVDFVEFFFNPLGVETTFGLLHQVFNVHIVCLFFKGFNDFQSLLIPNFTFLHKMFKMVIFRQMSGKTPPLGLNHDLISSLYGL
jgi:hypothetical protein